jgi:hypothetical protein
VLNSTLSNYVSNSVLTTQFTNFTNDVLVPYYASIYGENHWTNSSNSFTSFSFVGSINNVTATTFDYLKNITSDVQTQLNNITSNYALSSTLSTYYAGLYAYNTFTGSNTFSNNNLFSGGYNTFSNLINSRYFTTYKANFKYLQVEDLYVGNMIMNSFNNVYVNADSSNILYSAQCGRYGISTIVNTYNGQRQFIIDSTPTEYNIGQIIYIYHANLNAGTWLSIGSVSNTQQFLIGSVNHRLFRLSLFQSVTLIFIGNGTWMGTFSDSIPVALDSSTSVTVTGLSYTYPTIQTFDNAIQYSS